MDRDRPASPPPRGSYEVELSGAVPASLRAAFPVAGVRRTPAETVLTTEVRHGAELDALLDKVLFMGLVLTEVHERRSGEPMERGSR